MVQLKEKKKIFVGLSGGVDSSVAALRLKRAGYDVVGVFIKTWHPDFIECNEEAERLDAMRVAAYLKIPFLTLDAEAAYKKDVADYMIAEYRAGRTPNPDVMCNKYVKFGAFLDFALSHGADAVATGHYARVESSLRKDQGKTNWKDLLKTGYRLLRGADNSKDQSYFLWTLTEVQLSKIYFPIGDTKKEDIRKEAKAAGLPTAKKPDSQGICFLGEVDMKDFLSHYIEVKKGDVLDEEGNVIGAHEGALYYTLGERHGFLVHNATAKETPHYVVAKDIDKNTITVSDHPPVLHTEEGMTLSECNLRGITADNFECEAQFRYRQKPFKVTVNTERDYSNILKNIRIMANDADIEKPSRGQSCVLYRGNECLGGGIIE